MAKINALIDDFNDGVIGPIWGTSGTVTESGGTANLTPSVAGAVLQAVTFYDLIDSSIIVNVSAVTVNGLTGSMTSALALGHSDGNDLFIEKRGSNLKAGYRSGGVITDLYTDPFNLAIHDWWRIRGTATTVFWDVSAYGVAWVNIAANLLPFPIANLLPYFFAAYSGTEVNFSPFSINAVNPGLVMTAAGVSTSNGTVNFTIVYALRASGASVSDGSAAFTIPPLSSHPITASGASVTDGMVVMTIIPVAPSTLQISAAGASVSDGSANFAGFVSITANGVSSSMGSAQFIIPFQVIPGTILQFEPPVVFDTPPYHSKTRGRELIYARHRPSQPRGRTVLKKTARIPGQYPQEYLYPELNLFPGEDSGTDTYTIVDTPTIEELAGAVIGYQGGHIYTVDADEAQALLNAGFTINRVSATSGRLIQVLTTTPYE